MNKRSSLSISTQNLYLRPKLKVKTIDVLQIQSTLKTKKRFGSHSTVCRPELRKPKLKVGDQVRLSMTRMRFGKGYLPGWTDELF